VGWGTSGLREQVHWLPCPLVPSPNLSLSMSASGSGFPSRHSGLVTWSVPGCDLLNPSLAYLNSACWFYQATAQTGVLTQWGLGVFFFKLILFNGVLWQVWVGLQTSGCFLPGVLLVKVST
jgi:hypothetical protein